MIYNSINHYIIWKGIFMLENLVKDFKEIFKYSGEVETFFSPGHILLVQRVKDQVSNAFLVLIDVIVQDFDLGRSHYLLRLGDHDAISLKRCYPVADALVGLVRLVHFVDQPLFILRNHLSGNPRNTEIKSFNKTYT